MTPLPSLLTISSTFKCTFPLKPYLRHDPLHVPCVPPVQRGIDRPYCFEQPSVLCRLALCPVVRIGLLGTIPSSLRPPRRGCIGVRWGRWPGGSRGRYDLRYGLIYRLVPFHEDIPPVPFLYCSRLVQFVEVLQGDILRGEYTDHDVAKRCQETKVELSQRSCCRMQDCGQL